MRTSRASLLLLGLLGVVLGCSSSTDTTLPTTEDTAVPTSVTVLPKNFLGGVPCSSTPGAMQSYVATLTDTTDSARPFQLPSSAPTPCSQPIAFRYVVAGHEYRTNIDGYELPASAITPAITPSSGSQQMVQLTAQGPVCPAPPATCATPQVCTRLPATEDRKCLAPAIPRWTASCRAVTSDTAENVDVTACDPLADHGSLAPTGIEVGIAGALGLLRCTSMGGTIARFDVKPADPSLPPIAGFPCDGGLASYTIMVKEGVLYTFSVEAYGDGGNPPGNDGGSSPVYTATCSATTKKGLTVLAVCEPLTLKP